MKRICTLLLLLLTCTLCAQAQKWSRWSSARERRLEGPVRTLVERCSSIGTSFKYGYQYEFARDGELMVITSFQIEQPIRLLVVQPYKVTKRNERGDAAEASFFHKGELERKERYVAEYDSIGNWTKLVTYVMRDYELAGSGTAGKWLAKYECLRTIEYYP